MIELLKKKEKFVGIKQVKRAAEQDILAEVFIASDADQRVIGSLKQICEDKNIPIYTVDTMKQLGKAAGIDVGAAIVGILKS